MVTRIYLLIKEEDKLRRNTKEQQKRYRLKELLLNMMNGEFTFPRTDKNQTLEDQEGSSISADDIFKFPAAPPSTTEDQQHALTSVDIDQSAQNLNNISCLIDINPKTTVKDTRSTGISGCEANAQREKTSFLTSEASFDQDKHHGICNWDITYYPRASFSYEHCIIC